MLNRYSKDLSEKLAEKCRDFTNQRLARRKRCHKKCITEEVISSSFLILSYWFILQHNNISRLKQARNADHIRYTYTMAMEQPAAGENYFASHCICKDFSSLSTHISLQKYSHSCTKQRSPAQKSSFLEIPCHEAKLSKNGDFSKIGDFFSRIAKISSSGTRNKESVAPGLM